MDAKDLSQPALLSVSNTAGFTRRHSFTQLKKFERIFTRMASLVLMDMGRDQNYMCAIPANSG